MFLILPLHPSHSATVAPLRGKRLSPGRPGLQAACAEPSVSGGFHWGDGSLPGSNSSVPEFWWHRLQGPGVEEAAAGSLDEAEVCCQLGRPCALSFPGGSESKESTYNAGDLGSIPGLGKSPGEGNGNPVQYSGLENSMDRGAWQATVQAVAKSWMGPRDFHHHLCFGERPHSAQYSGLENPMDGGAWWATVRGVAKSRRRLSHFTFTFCEKGL